ncbi:MAG: hypothetical protein LBS57_01595 [Treponema sp.]|jgi:hypothetical protein|nr:hypothetical protein [Treponema sp.]
MMPGENPVIISKDSSFDAVLDEVCDRLMDRQIQYSIRRIHELENRLSGLERELDEFLLQKTDKQGR